MRHSFLRRPSALLASIALIALLAPFAVAVPAAAQEATVATDTESVLAHLTRTRQLFLDSIAGLTPEQWSWKPAPERWSVAECAEHITLSESFLRELLRGAITTPADAAVLAKSHGKSPMILKFIVDRSQKFQAPEPINPAKQSEIRSREQIERDFSFERGRTHELLASAGDLTSFASMNPAFQELDLAGWAYFLSGHSERHTLQIQEVKASPGWPKR